jgi:uncharacterized protein (TIGR03086 family)
MHALTSAAVEPARRVVAAIGPDQLDRPTPCPDFDVRALIGHLLEWGPALVAAGYRAEPTTSYPDLDGYLDAIAAAWGRPQAWTGTASLGGHEMPATTMGGMVLGEVVVHGWDLARASGQPVDWPEELLDFLCAEVDRTGEQGRAMGVYGPVVPVPPEASTLDRLIGLTGRDPGWTYRPA